MKLLIIILMTCGQPSMILVKPGDGPVSYYDYEQIDMQILKERMEENESEVWVVPDTTGICT